jgi:putative methyltransferase (TIGR04325 family)
LEWEYLPSGWPADEATPGWHHERVRAAYEAKLPAVRRAVAGSGPLAFTTSALLPLGAPSLWEQNVLLTYAYALALASRATSRISVLDWGGGLGFLGLVGRAYLPPEVELDYHVKELSAIAAAGRELVPEVTFHDSDSCLDRDYDLVLSTSALQYARDWEDLLAGLCSATRRLLYLGKLPVALPGPSYVFRHRAARYGIDTAFPTWVLGRDPLVAAARSHGLELVREFLVDPGVVISGAPARAAVRGFLFHSGTAQAA